ncbi:hypothetical protein LCGC14_2617250, partial [marine sediment metagenome]
LSTQVTLGIDDGLKHNCSIHCDELISIPKRVLTNFVTTLSHDKIKELVRNVAPDVTGFDFARPYFFGNLHTIRMDWSVKITRLTRKSTHTYDGFDGQNCNPVGPVRHAESGVWLYHYSRIGDPQVIAKRVRNVDTFFHAEENLPQESELPPYDFTTREYDSYAFTENPKQTNSELLIYQGTHPLPFAELYQEFE